jgi:hypothetical protein
MPVGAAMYQLSGKHRKRYAQPGELLSSVDPQGHCRREQGNGILSSLGMAVAMNIGVRGGEFVAALGGAMRWMPNVLLKVLLLCVSGGASGLEASQPVPI